MTFGQYITEGRKKAIKSQKEFAASLTKDDGTPISAQYLNDLEHDRRNPPGEYLLNQFASKLNLSLDYLRYLAGTLPKDIRRDNPKPDKVEEAFKAFRKVLEEKSEMDSR